VKLDDSPYTFLIVKPHAYPLTLSKHTQLMEPATLMTLEFMQYILQACSLFCAYSLPTVSAAGKAGGITIVIRSSALIATSPAAIDLSICELRGIYTLW
jgi:hypothetical protein